MVAATAHAMVQTLGARLPNFGLCAAAGHVETPAAALARLSPR